MGFIDDIKARAKTSKKTITELWRVLNGKRNDRNFF